ncbi:MAG: hypothetical protein E6G66_06680 [Actinobacteria bacterium]|nr:MAG: hypothetical protein E6G66_06680 [Actinomycetota bacterium]
MADLLSIDDLPPDFEYPQEFIRVVELGLTNLEPWWILEGEGLALGEPPGEHRVMVVATLRSALVDLVFERVVNKATSMSRA